jgi:hypothetical protein
LEAVTNKENIMRGVSPAALNARKTHCIRGHSFLEYGVEQLRSGGKLWRYCKKCKSDKRKAGCWKGSGAAWISSEQSR